MSDIIQRLTPEAGALIAQQIEGNPAMRASIAATLSTYQVMQQFLAARIPELEQQLEMARHNATAVEHNLQILVTALGGTGGLLS